MSAERQAAAGSGEEGFDPHAAEHDLPNHQGLGEAAVDYIAANFLAALEQTARP